KELEETVDALTDEIVDLKQRVEDLEDGATTTSSASASVDADENDNDEPGVSLDETDEDDDIYVA
ncbi:MAG: hypothetical protein SV760_00520, partial [Halobacteria archaeon]|nr:hypothetical protein [Halobacteria archaeon]